MHEQSSHGVSSLHRISVVISFASHAALQLPSIRYETKVTFKSLDVFHASSVKSL
jgi:hypothetical protein